MGICAITAREIERHMPGDVLTLGAQDGIESVDLKGGRVDAVDVKPHKGVELLADLNYPVALGQYDLVVDCGTTEHCPNIFQAVKNAADAVKVGGKILHHSPVSFINHGYFNFCPVFFLDYYTENHWKIERFDLMNRQDELVTDCNGNDVFGRLGHKEELLMLVVATRLPHSTTGRYPLQKEYQ